MATVAAAEQRLSPPVVERLNGLLEVAQVINSSLELDEVLEHILTQAEYLLNAESGSIMLLDEAERQLRVVAAHGPRAGAIRGRRLQLGQGIAGWVALHGTPLLLHGPQSDPRFRRVVDRQDVRDALCVPLQAEDRILGVISLNNSERPAPFDAADLELLTALGNQAALAIKNASSFQEMRRQRRTVERLLTEVTRAQEEERMRIAIQIHDGPAQTMFAALRNLETIRALAGRDSETQELVLNELERTVRHAIDETRALMVDLRPPAVEHVGLYSALRQYAKQFQQRTGIRTTVSREGGDRQLPVMVRSCFYRIAQEALTNVWKHADAQTACVHLHTEDTLCSLEIRDDGKGLDPEKQKAAREGDHLGMAFLQERTELLGGRLTVASGNKSGTVVRVTVPLTE
jgi:two-component system NarL family sensor kinase